MVVNYGRDESHVVIGSVVGVEVKPKMNDTDEVKVNPKQPLFDILDGLNVKYSKQLGVVKLQKLVDENQVAPE